MNNDKASPVALEQVVADLAHELYAMAQGPQPIEDAVAAIAKRLASFEAAPVAPLLMQDENSGRDGRRYNEWHASRPDARLNAREAAQAVMPAAPSDAADAARWRFAMDWGTKDFAVCYRDGNAWVPIKNNGPIDAALSQTMQPQAKKAQCQATQRSDGVWQCYRTEWECGRCERNEPAAGEQAGAVAEPTAEKNWFDPVQGGFVKRTADDFSSVNPPMCRIAGVNPDVLRRAALAAPGAAIAAREQETLTNDNSAADWLTTRAHLHEWLADGAQMHPRTINLVVRFARALAEKLAAAEKKYGYSDGWLSPGWMDECRAKLMEHIAKGDPRDVAAYCAFLWHHGESTASREEAPATPQAGPSDDEQLVATLIHCSRQVSSTAMTGYDLASVLSRAAERIQFLTQPTTVQQAK